MRKFIITLLSLFLTAFLYPVKAYEPTIDVNLISNNAYVIDITNNQVLLDKDSEMRIYPASMTKMMTAIIAIEKLPDVEEKITFTEEMIAGLYEAQASMAGYTVGDEATVLELFYGVALPSGADASNALAYRISGGIDGFVEEMNKKATEIGMENTHFMNATGLHDDNHYSTCRDIAKLLEYCMQNELFKTIFSTTTYITSPTILYPEGIEEHSTFKYYLEESNIDIPGLIGGKTGFTGPAGHSLASWSNLNGMEIICIVAQGMDGMYSTSHLSDTKQIMDTLNNWSKQTLLTEGETLQEITIHHHYTDDKVLVNAGETITLDMPNEANVVREMDLISEIDSTLSPQQLSSPFIIKVDDEILYEKVINITIPREKSLFGRIIKRVKSLFS